MKEKFILAKEIELFNEIYIVYLKEVPTKIAPGGKPLRTTVRAFIKKHH